MDFVRFIIVFIVVTLLGGAFIYRHSLFKRCSRCRKWAWQTSYITEYSEGMICKACDDATIRGRFRASHR